MRQHARGGVSLQSLPHDFSRMNARSINCAAEEILTLDHAVAAVEVNHAEDFVLQLSEAQDQVVSDCSRRREKRAASHLVGQACASGVDDFVDRRLAHDAETMIVNEKRVERAHERAPS
jgi:hypothetical protein